MSSPGIPCPGGYGLHSWQGYQIEPGETMEKIGDAK